MKQIKIIIEQTKDGYTAYAQDLPGIVGQADTLFGVQDSIANAIHLFKGNNDKESWPEVLQDGYTLSFHMENHVGDINI